MEDIQILKQLLNGNHLEPSEFKRACVLSVMIQNEIQNREV